MHYGDNFAKKFWKKVKKLPSGCWKWTGGNDGRDGYGRVEFMGQRMKCHRVAFELAKHTIPEGSLVRHTCDNAWCVNPEHLLTGTHYDNWKDSVERGRAHVLRNERAVNKTLALKIRGLLEQGEWVLDVARECRVEKNVVRRIAMGETWQELGPIEYRRKPSGLCKLREKWKPGGYKEYAGKNRAFVKGVARGTAAA